MAAMTQDVTQSARRRAAVTCALCALTVAICAVLMTAVALAHAPAAVLPLAVAICIGCPIAMCWSLPRSIAVLRSRHAGAEAQAVNALRNYLARLPETEHPLGL